MEKSVRQALAELGARQISPFALAPIFLLIAIFALWVPLRLSLPDTRSATATVTEKYVTYEEDATIRHLRYAFIANETEFSGSSWVHPATYLGTSVGDSLAVRYAAGDPSINRYVDDYFVLANEGALGFFSLLIVALTPLAWWRIRSLRSGRLTPGTGARLPLA